MDQFSHSRRCSLTDPFSGPGGNMINTLQLVELQRHRVYPNDSRRSVRTISCTLQLHFTWTIRHHKLFVTGNNFIKIYPNVDQRWLRCRCVLESLVGMCCYINTHTRPTTPSPMNYFSGRNCTNLQVIDGQFTSLTLQEYKIRQPQNDVPSHIVYVQVSCLCRIDHCW